ncbi:AB-hydrolase YheT [Dendrothele bispora CBS 962.96]|uniref:AB-hydrolase YheT n=1 Tax=Dendrothele bispora (strain CBS 962.96) TaxID=1314807 RepID=A0A4S8MU65_DENBC|nr:AB-hydrolase YheT [Dendrothele bispora CBS 962.96]
MGPFNCFSTPRPPIVHFASKTSHLQVRAQQDSESQQTKTASLRHLVSTKCPSLFTPYEPAWWLKNGHLQTMFSVFNDLSQVDPMWYRRQLLELVDGGTLGLDFAPIDDSVLREDTPIIVVQHGLTGGSYEPYLKAIVARAIEPPERGGLGYRVVVVHFRGCGGVPMSTPRFYSAGGTDDIRQALIYISHKYPNAPLLGLGFSLGANIMTRYIAEEGEKSRLCAGCTLACPWDLDANDRLMTSSWTGQKIYGPALGGNLVALIKRHHKVMVLDDPTHAVAQVVPTLLAVKDITLHKYDDTFARLVAGPPPLFPLPSAEAYYKAMSSHDSVKNIRVPYLSINAADDPVVRHVPLDGGENPLVVMALTAYGGHLGWFKDGGGKDRWTTKPVLEWLRMVGDVIERLPLAPVKIYVDIEGFLREESAGEGLGCREKEGGGLINGNGGEDGVFRGL